MANSSRVDKNLFENTHYLGKPAAEEDRIVSRRLEILQGHPEFFGSAYSCIEVGCGSGASITRISAQFNKTLGIDIFDYSADFGIQKEKNNAVNSEFLKLDLEKDPLPPPFDRLISFEVIEHLRSEDSVAAYNKILKQDGMAAISVPNKWWIFETHGAKLPLLPWNRVPFFSWLPKSIHERYANARIYSMGRIIKLLHAHGLSVIDQCYITAPMDVLKEGRLKRFLLKYIFRKNTTRNPFLSTSLFLLVQKKIKCLMNSCELKILSIIPYKVLPAALGGEKGIVLFTEYLSEQVAVTAVSTKNNDPALAKGYRLLNILSNSRSRYFNVFLYRRLKDIIKKENPTHLLIEHPYYGWLAWLLNKALRIKWVVHSHNIEYMRSRSIGRWWWKALQWYEGWVYRKADKIFFISEDDQAHAHATWDIKKDKTLAVTYGIEQSGIPDDIEACRIKIMARHGIASGTKLLLFNGALYHATNYDALNVILNEINPILRQKEDFVYKILVCGKGLPESFNDLKDYASQNIVYAGFVDDISEYFKAADVFLNPILSGGGVKTKAIEALAMNCTVVSTELGAMGIKKEVCGQKLIIIEDENWTQFGETIISAAASELRIPKEFFAHYYWADIIKNAISFLTDPYA